MLSQELSIQSMLLILSPIVSGTSRALSDSYENSRCSQRSPYDHGQYRDHRYLLILLPITFPDGIGRRESINSICISRFLLEELSPRESIIFESSSREHLAGVVDALDILRESIEIRFFDS